MTGQWQRRVEIFISTDIEGTAGIAHWDEAERSHADYEEFRDLMTGEVLAACEGALAAGATEVVIKDAHDSGQNLALNRLPENVKIMRGWSGHPDAMMFGIDPSFAAAIYTDYHSKAVFQANPLAHSTNLRISRLILNGEVASEFTMNSLTAARHTVSSVFLSGDAEMCRHAVALVPGIHTVATLEGFGRASLSISPARARQAIRDGVEKALKTASSHRTPAAGGPFEISLEFVTPSDAWRSSFYPGAYLNSPRAVGFKGDTIFEIQRALRFLTQ
ncbi:M55 family metallopeptidase [Cypionkella psychrotolerans]|uniref:M55 family metallopeptidase n=1 Tax=Cypionkella psychrotolerans TaxID=1678131 RepID=UPI0006B492BA|nr:M55 family metallopeptidase [Cypionkella psychrotolerans]